MRPNRTAHAERIVNASRVFDKEDFSLLEEDFSKTLTFSSILLSEETSTPIIHLFTDGSLLVKTTRQNRTNTPYLILPGEDALYEFIADLYENDRSFLNLFTETLKRMSDSIQPDIELKQNEGRHVISRIFSDCAACIHKE